VTGIVNLNKLLHNKDERHESDEVLHELLRHPHEQTKAVSMGTAGAGCECCEC
jgi:hypothetical protein